MVGASVVAPFVPSVPPTFDAELRKFFREFANSFTDYGTMVGLKAVARKADGSIIRDRYGNPTYAAQVDYPALVLWKNTLISTATGTQNIVDGTVIFSWPPPTIHAEDHLVIDGVELPITGVSYDTSGDPMSPTKAFV